MENRLYRSLKDRILGGVCGGLASYLQIDVVLVRLFFLVFTLVGGVGPLVYIIMWILVPSEEGVYPGAQPYTINGEEIKEKAESMKNEFVNAVNKPGQKTALYAGIALVLVGAYLFLKNLDFAWLSWLNTNVILAALIAAAGVALLVVAIKRGK